jgi:hypothetical protein
MEIAVPALALGGLYILANKDDKHKKNVKENFESNLNQRIEGSNLKATRIEPIHSNVFPDKDENTSRRTILENYRRRKDMFKNAPTNENKNLEFTSLTGEQVPLKNFEHNNLQPFFGSTVRQRTFQLDGNETLLDNKQGTGSQLFSKKENAPLFKPEDNVNWNHGMPNHSSFIQSRMNPSMQMNNTKPWDEIHVAPGLNSGFSSEGKGGFNAGVQSRDQWEPKTVDELRAKNNPKKTYDGVTLGPKYFNQERGVIGSVEKNRPERAWEHGGARFFTTTGQHIKPTGRSEQMLGFSNRVNTTKEYFGPSGENQQSRYVKGTYEESKRQQLGDVPVGSAYAVDKYEPTNGDYSSQGYNILPNERSLTENNDRFGVVSTIAKEIIMPIQDLLRPSRKQNVIGNARPSGNAGSSVSRNTNYYSDKAKVTRKEMTVENDFMFNVGSSVNNVSGSGMNPQQAIFTNRGETGCTDYGGIAGPAGDNARATDYTSAYNAYLNENKEKSLVGRTNAGNTNMFNNYENMNVRKNDQKCNTHPTPARAMNFQGPSSNTYGHLSNSRFNNNKTITCERNTSEMVQQFNNNPYTHPLGSVA